MNDEQRPSSARLAPARVLILVFVAILALDHYHNHLSRTPGIDFYQYWGVPTARSISAEPLGTPYAASERYDEILEDYSLHSTDKRLEAVTGYWHTLDLASDPLLYVIGGWLPTHYTTALKIYQFLQFLALGVALLLLGRRAAFPGLETATLGLLMFVYYMPVLSELRVLNTNAIQLGAIVLASSLLAVDRKETREARHAIALCLTVLVAFLKPVWVLLPALATIHLLRRHGREVMQRAIAIAAAFGMILFLWPSLVFGLSVWSDWYHEVFRSEAGRLLYGIEEGNRAAPMMLAEATGLGLGQATGLLAAVLALSLLAATATLLRTEGPGRWRIAAAALADRLLDRPAIALSLGIVTMLALSPLAWWHYYTLALLPIFTLVSPGSSRAQTVLAGLAFLLSSGRLGPVYVWFADGDWATAFGAAFAWAPLWLGLLLPPARPDVALDGE